jgi:hypothetical protein
MQAAVAPFGRMLDWRQSRNKSVSLVRCLLIDPTRVPRSVVEWKIMVSFNLHSRRQLCCSP